jgi:hypothetical protein
LSGEQITDDLDALSLAHDPCRSPVSLVVAVSVPQAPRTVNQAQSNSLTLERNRAKTLTVIDHLNIE